MPTYDYECDACGHTFEKFQSMTARPIRTCPKCQRRKVRRLIGTGAGVIFRGSGFYATDYRSESYKKAAEKDKPAAAGAGEKKGESQAAGKKAGSEPASEKPSKKPAKTGTNG